MNRVQSLIKWSERPLVLTGAGLSVESGLSTYRDSNGEYKEASIRRVFELSERESIEDMWNRLLPVARMAQQATPNLGHRLLKALEVHKPQARLITQNIDGLHARAGQKSLLEIHGSLMNPYCGKCGQVFKNYDYMANDTSLPMCHDCSTVLTPDIIGPGEVIPWERQKRYDQFVEGHDLMIVVGTSASFDYIQETVKETRYRGLPIIEINPQETPVSKYATVRLSGSAVSAIQSVLTREALKPATRWEKISAIIRMIPLLADKTA